MPNLHRDSLRELVGAKQPSLVCIQESKLDVVSDYDIMQMVGAQFDYSLPAVHTGGGGGFSTLASLGLVPLERDHPHILTLCQSLPGEDGGGLVANHHLRPVEGGGEGLLSVGASRD
jgi:hypothetical protein